MKLIWEILLGIVCLIILFAAYIQFFPSPKQNIAFPDVTLLSDSFSLARGDCLIFGPAHCVGCHSKREDEAAVNNGEIVALAGGKFFDTPTGNIYPQYHSRFRNRNWKSV